MSSTSTTSEDSIQVLDSYQLTEFGPIYTMAENGSRNAARGGSEDGTEIQVDIRYNLKNGRVVYRTYPVDRDIFNENAVSRTRRKEKSLPRPMRKIFYP